MWVVLSHSVVTEKNPGGSGEDSNRVVQHAVNVRGVEQHVVASLYADDTVLLAESEGLLQRIVDEFDSVCKRRKLKVNAGKSKVMVFERAREQTKWKLSEDC